MGAPDYDDTAARQGAVFILFLNSSSQLRAVQRISDSEGDLGGLPRFSNFGSSLTTIDLLGEGNLQLVVGAQGETTATTLTGEVYVLFLNNDGTVAETVRAMRTRAVVCGCAAADPAHACCHARGA